MWPPSLAGEVDFTDASFSSGKVVFTDATFSGGTVNFSLPSSWSVPPLVDWYHNKIRPSELPFVWHY